LPKSVTKDYNDRDPNIKTAWFWEKLFYDNINKALKKIELETRARADYRV